MPTVLQPLTVSISIDWTTVFASYLATRRLSSKSIKLATQHLRVFSLWHEATFHQAFTSNQVTNYDLHLYRKHSLEVERVKAATWNSRHWALGIFCEYIGAPELMNDVEQKEVGRVSTKHRSLTDDEYHRLVHALEQNTRRALSSFEHSNAVRDWAALSLMLHGLRVEEVSLLQVDDLTINERSGNALVRNGKGSKERSVPLNLFARKALTAWLGTRPEGISLFGVAVRTLQRSVADLGAQIGVPDLTPHWLRYTFAKRLEKNGATLENIRDLLGHKDIQTTIRYLRSSAEELQSAVEGVM
jgi:site-specific recombinase XerD